MCRRRLGGHKKGMFRSEFGKVFPESGCHQSCSLFMDSHKLLVVRNCMLVVHPIFDSYITHYTLCLSAPANLPYDFSSSTLAFLTGCPSVQIHGH